MYLQEEETSSEDKLQPTHYSQLDPKIMNVQSLRTELKARAINSKGLKSQLIARLTKALKTESEKTEDEVQEVDQNDSKMDVDEKQDNKKESEEKKMDEKEKQQLEKKFTLPDEPQIIAHPSRTAKSGKFDCTVMSLSLLLDYRPEDTKEHSFEVSLFAELFNEMLMRDFGFNIYKAIHSQPEKVEEKGKDERKKKDEKDKPEKNDKNGDKQDDKKNEKKSKDEEECEEIDEDDDSKDDKKDKEKRKSSDRDKKKKERTRLITKDKNLLLSFVYFDQTHCGYIFEKDIEELIYTLGLNLSRAQVRKLVAKVITRDSLHYRKLTDRPKDETEQPATEEKVEILLNIEELAFGNKRLLPVFRTGFSSESNSENKANAEDNKNQLAEGNTIFL